MLRAVIRTQDDPRFLSQVLILGFGADDGGAVRTEDGDEKGSEKGEHGGIYLEVLRAGHYWAATGGFVLRPVVCSGLIPALSASSRPQ